MGYKIFISHKKEDEGVALDVKKTLVKCGVEAYLDLLDNTISGDGEKLTEHIKEKLSGCTDVIVVLSEQTKKSWWVPFEIGMATQNDMPIANYLTCFEKLPDFLEYWPRLKNQQDVLKYVESRNKVARQQEVLEKTLNDGYSQRADGGLTETQRFYAELKRNL